MHICDACHKERGGDVQQGPPQGATNLRSLYRPGKRAGKNLWRLRPPALGTLALYEVAQL